MNKCYVEICYTYENRRGSFFPPVAIIEVDGKDGELIKNLIDRAMDKLREKYSNKTLYMVNSKYLGNSLEIIF